MELFKSLTHPSELRALVQYKFLGGQNAVMPKLDYVRARTASKSIAYVTVPLSAYQDAFCFLSTSGRAELRDEEVLPAA